MESFYTNEIKEYNSNYDLAVAKIESIISSMKNLSNSFNSSSGNDIVAIKADLSKLVSDLQSVKSKITKIKKDTNIKANNSDKVYKEIKALAPTPTFKSRDYVFESTGQKKVFIENGIIYWEESFRKIPISSYNGLFGGVAAVGKLFNSYEIITSKTHADVDSMLKGVKKML